MGFDTIEINLVDSDIKNGASLETEQKYRNYYYW